MENLTLNGTIENKLASGTVTMQEMTDYIVVHFYADLRRLALSILHNTAEAEDIAQQVVIQAVRKIDRYRSGSNLKSWLFKITVNQSRNLLRRKQAKQRLQNVLALRFKRDSKQQIAPSPEQELMRTEQNKLLWAAVSELHDKHQLPILLRYDFELSDLEISEVLGIPHGTVRSRLHHAHRQLHAILGVAGVTKR